jgi:hypothetical protein
VLFIREIDLEKSERILAILSDKEGSRIITLPWYDFFKNAFFMALWTVLTPDMCRFYGDRSGS